MTLLSRGWARFPADGRSRAWAAAAWDAARPLLDDPVQAHWWRHGATWFAGVGVLPNEMDGAVGGVPLAGSALDALNWTGGWHRAQVSVTRPGYPGRDAGESDAAHRYRRTRDAAHVDGLLPVGSERRRMAREYHGFILGIALTEADPDAAPLVVWEGSHRIVGEAFRTALGAVPVDDWAGVDLTETYHTARRAAFETCRRVPLPLAPGEGVLVHRLALHGVAPWEPGATADPDGRAIAYFRPEIAADAWLRDDRVLTP